MNILSKHKFVSLLVIIINYNGEKTLKDCLLSIKKQTFKNFKLLIIDNGSKDKSINIIKRLMPDANVIRKRKNHGVSIAKNIGVKLAIKNKISYVLFLDNDTAFGERLFDDLIKTMSLSQKTVICGVKVLDTTKRHKIQEIGSDCDVFGYPYTKFEGKNINEVSNLNKPFETFFVSACCMIVKVDLFKKIGMFDNKYFRCAEEVDLCWRAKIAGYKIMINPNISIYHVGGGTGSFGLLPVTTTERRYFAERNTLRMLLKNYSAFTLLLVVPLFVIISFLELLAYLILIPKLANPFIKAIYWNLQNINDTWALHKSVQKLRKVSDFQIMRSMIFGSAKLKIFLKVGTPVIK